MKISTKILKLWEKREKEKLKKKNFKTNKESKNG